MSKKRRRLEEHVVEIDHYDLPPGLERITCLSPRCDNDSRVRDARATDEEWDFVKTAFIKSRHPCTHVRVPDGFVEVA